MSREKLDGTERIEQLGKEEEEEEEEERDRLISTEND